MVFHDFFYFSLEFCARAYPPPDTDTDTDFSEADADPAPPQPHFDAHGQGRQRPSASATMNEAFEEAIEEVINDPKGGGRDSLADNSRTDASLDSITAGLAGLEVNTEEDRDLPADENGAVEAEDESEDPFPDEHSSDEEMGTLLSRLSGLRGPVNRIFLDEPCLYGYDDLGTEHAEERHEHDQIVRSFKDHRRDNLILGLTKPCGHKWSTHEYIARRSGYIRRKCDMMNLPRDFAFPHLRIIRVEITNDPPGAYPIHPVLMDCVMQQWYTGTYTVPTGPRDRNHLIPIKLFPKPIPCMESPMHFHMSMLSFAIYLEDPILVEDVVAKIRAVLKPATSVNEWLTLAKEVYNNPDSPLRKLGDEMVRGMVVATALRHSYTWWMERPEYLPEEFEGILEQEKGLDGGRFGADLFGSYDHLKAAGALVSVWGGN